jgi:hypothetical protein
MLVHPDGRFAAQAKGSSVVVLTPFYREDIDADELVSIRQLRRAFPERTLLAIGPQHVLNAKPEWLALYDGYEVFPEHWFSSVAAYNAFMMSDEFYARFSKHEFILLAQTDSTAFHDELDHWCSMEIDYIGAPWLRDLSKSWLPTLADRRLKRRGERFRRLDIRQRDGTPHYGQRFYAVGNGGFSLRRTDAFRECLSSNAELRDCTLRDQLMTGHPYFNEDVFFSVIVHKSGKQLRIPDYRTAIHFSLESGVPYGLKLLNGKLPFGCHAWARFKDDWRVAFQQVGLSI